MFWPIFHFPCSRSFRCFLDARIAFLNIPQCSIHGIGSVFWNTLVFLCNCQRSRLSLSRNEGKFSFWRYGYARLVTRVSYVEDIQFCPTCHAKIWHTQWTHFSKFLKQIENSFKNLSHLMLRQEMMKNCRKINSFRKNLYCKSISRNSSEKVNLSALKLFSVKDPILFSKWSSISLFDIDFW